MNAQNPRFAGSKQPDPDEGSRNAELDETQTESLNNSTLRICEEIRSWHVRSLQVQGSLFTVEAALSFNLQNSPISRDKLTRRIFDTVCWFMEVDGEVHLELCGHKHVMHQRGGDRDTDMTDFLPCVEEKTALGLPFFLGMEIEESRAE
jgi:hypothetical protein